MGEGPLSIREMVKYGILRCYGDDSSNYWFGRISSIMQLSIKNEPDVLRLLPTETKETSTVVIATQAACGDQDRKRKTNHDIEPLRG
jgi:hypothetical protein